MKRIFASIFVLALSVGLFALGSAWPRGRSMQRTGLLPAVQAQEAERAAVNGKSAPFPSRRECTNGSVVGRFGSTVQGTLLPPLTPVPVPLVAVGWFEVDSAGNVTGADTLSLGGQIIPRTVSGTFNVNPNCTVTGRLNYTGQPPTPVNFSAVIMDGGNEIQLIETDPGTLITGVGKRL